MPLYNWLKCGDGDLKYTRKNLDKGNLKGDQDAWDIIYQQYIDRFGLSKLYEKMLNQMRKKADLELDYIISGDKFKLTLLEMETRRLESMLSTAGTGISTDQTLIHLSKWVGYWIKSKEISVLEFFNLAKEYERFIKLSNGKKD